MKNPFTRLTNKFTQTFDNVRQTIFRQRKKDEGTKKETHRGKGGGSSKVPAHVVLNDFNKNEFVYTRTCNVKAVRLCRRKNKIAARSRRINRIHVKYRTKARF